jgi:hypothetical protein
MGLLAAALALRYEHFPNAFLPLARAIASADPGNEEGTARDFEAAMPQPEGAGRVLGTAADVRASSKTGYLLYTDQVKALETLAWGIDELDLLSEPQAYGHIPPGKLGFAIVTRSGRRGFGDDHSMGPRLIVANMMLRARSLDRFALDVGREFRDLTFGTG